LDEDEPTNHFIKALKRFNLSYLNSYKRMTKERKSYMGIPLTIKTDGQDFKHVKRLNKGVIYKSTDGARMIKKCIVYREEFFEELKYIGAMLNDFKSECFLYMFHEWDGTADKMYMTEWIPHAKPFNSIPRIDERIKILREIEYNLYLLFDEGYYWDGDWSEDILITKEESFKICDLDSIKPIWINSTFDQHYPWHWIFDNLKTWKS